MAFEVVEPGVWQPREPLGEGECAIGRNGAATFRAEDLAGVGIDNYCVLLADSATLRIALRAVRDGEQQISLAASTITRKQGVDSGRRRVCISRGLKKLGLKAEAVAGRLELTVKGDELLILNLAGEQLTKAEDGTEE